MGVGPRAAPAAPAGPHCPPRARRRPLARSRSAAAPIVLQGPRGGQRPPVPSPVPSPAPCPGSARTGGERDGASESCPCREAVRGAPPSRGVPGGRPPAGPERVRAGPRRGTRTAAWGGGRGPGRSALTTTKIRGYLCHRVRPSFISIDPDAGRLFPSGQVHSPLCRHTRRGPRGHGGLCGGEMGTESSCTRGSCRARLGCGGAGRRGATDD